jgi:hypothetical protein
LIRFRSDFFAGLHFRAHGRGKRCAMGLHEEDFLAASSLVDVQDLVAKRAVDLRKPDHKPLDEKEIWWALEATLRILNESQNKSLMI